MRYMIMNIRKKVKYVNDEFEDDYVQIDDKMLKHLFRLLNKQTKN